MFENTNYKKAMIAGIIVIAVIWLFRLGSPELIMRKLLILPGLILGLTIHEYSHARTSDKFGDPTPASQGRLTLNPLAHMDPIGTVFLLIAGFGWGKPVAVDATYYRNPAKESMLVALAGPVSNLILAFLLFLAYGFGYYFLPNDELWGVILLGMLVNGAYINLGLGIFNLLPFPPLDGSKIIVYFLKGKAKEFIWTLERYSWIILSFLFITEIPSLIITPIVNGIATGMVWVVERILVLFI